MRSIRSRLLGWLFCGVAAGSGAAGFDIIDRALNEAGKLFNYGQCALVLPPQPNQAANLAKRWVPVKQGITGEHIPIGIGDTTGGPIFCSSHDATLPRDPAGFDTIGHADPHWRTDGLEPANRCVRVAQPTSAREEPMPRLAVRAVSPLVLFLTVAIAPVILVLRAMARDLAPRSALPPRFGARTHNALGTTNPDRSRAAELRTPVEVLDSRCPCLNAASHAWRTVVTDFARELHMTLPALTLSPQGALHNGRLSDSSPATGCRKARLNRLIRLAQHLRQLVCEDALTPLPWATVSLRRLSEQVISDFLLMAEEKDIGLGLAVRPPVTDDDPCDVAADPRGLVMLLNDLLGKAIGFTPRGGKIVVVLTRVGGRPGFEVIENGPAVPE